MTQATQLLSRSIPADVLGFAAKHGLSNYLPAVIEMTERIFPDAHLAVRLEDDPEILDDWHIVLDMDVSIDVPEAVSAQRHWNDSLFRCCPAPLVCYFRLSMELVES